MPRIWRYEVTAVGGSMVGRLNVGDILIDRWKASPVWEVIDLKKVESTGWWEAKRLDEVTEPTILSGYAERHGLHYDPLSSDAGRNLPTVPLGPE